jgi:hypothetical protein
MNEWNIRQEDLQDPHAPPPPREGRKGRVAFCPTCKRPFLRGTGVRQPPPAPAPGGAPEAPPAEYCSEECLPGLLA